MSKIFNVYLKDKTNNPGWSQSDTQTVGVELKKLFDAVCARPETTFTTSAVLLNPAKGSIKNYELLIYFVNSAAESVIDSAQTKFKVDPTKSGNTYYYGQAPRISEIYVQRVLQFTDRHLGLAKLCFHELMHNKLEDGKFSVHTDGGGGLAADGEINSSTPLTEENKKVMAPVLTRQNAQYQGAL